MTREELKYFSSLSKEELIKQLAWCMALSLFLSEDTEKPENEIYWYTREKAVEFIRTYRPMQLNLGWAKVLTEFSNARHEYDLDTLKKNAGKNWVYFMHPEISMQFVHES